MKDVVIGGGFISTHFQNYINPIYLSHNEWKKVPHDVNRVYYFAAYGNHYHQTDARECFEANVLLLEKVLELLQKRRFNLFVHISTSSVTLDKQTPYSLTKWAGERLVKTAGFPAISVRPYSIFGEGEADFRFIPKMINAILNKEVFNLIPEPTHDWLYVGDFVKRLNEIKKPGEPIGIGSGVLRSNYDVYKLVSQQIGETSLYFPTESMRSYDNKNWVCPTADVKKFKSKIDFDTGLKRTIKYYKDQYEKRRSLYKNS